MIYQFISEHRQEFPLKLMCRVLEVSVSGYFAWKGRPPSKHTREDKTLTETIKTIHLKSRTTYGAPRVKAELKEQGIQISCARITRLMKQAGLKVRCKRKFKDTTTSSHRLPVAQNLLERNFEAAEPNQKWTTDITYLPVKEGWLYLAVVLDLFSRKVVGWAMRETLQTELVISALEMARKNRQPHSGLLHHSDQGSQYASLEYRQALERLEAVQSMSRKGECWDNAVTESFFATLKMELELDQLQGTRAETRSMVFDYIESFYNRERCHSSLGYLSPSHFEERHSRLN